MRRSLIAASLLWLATTFAGAQDAGTAPDAASIDVSEADAAPGTPDEAAPTTASSEAEPYPSALEEPVVRMTTDELEALIRATCFDDWNRPKGWLEATSFVGLSCAMKDPPLAG